MCPSDGNIPNTAQMGVTNSGPEHGPVNKPAIGKGKPRRESKPRPAARPHKRLHDDVLSSRLTDMKKRISVLKSKLVLLEDRCAAHDAESVLRESES